MGAFSQFASIFNCLLFGNVFDYAGYIFSQVIWRCNIYMFLIILSYFPNPSQKPQANGRPVAEQEVKVTEEIPAVQQPTPDNKSDKVRIA